MRLEEGHASTVTATWLVRQYSNERNVRSECFSKIRPAAVKPAGLSDINEFVEDVLPHRCVIVPASTTVCLTGQYHIIEAAQVHAMTVPKVKVVASRDSVV